MMIAVECPFALVQSWASAAGAGGGRGPPGFCTMYKNPGGATGTNTVVRGL